MRGVGGQAGVRVGSQGEAPQATVMSVVSATKQSMSAGRAPLSLSAPLTPVPRQGNAGHTQTTMPFSQCLPEEPAASSPEPLGGSPGISTAGQVLSAPRGACDAEAGRAPGCPLLDPMSPAAGKVTWDHFLQAHPPAPSPAAGTLEVTKQLGQLKERGEQLSPGVPGGGGALK